MRRIAKFHKVSEKRFLEDWKDTFPDAEEEESERFMKRFGFPKELLQEAQAMISFHLQISVLRLVRSSKSQQESGWKWNRTGF